MNSTSQLTEKINLLAAALLMAAAIHTFLDLLGIPHVLAAARPGVFGIVLTILKLTLAVGGALGGAYVGYNALAMFNARSFGKARMAAMGAVALPFVGLCGMITGFILIPAGAACLFLLRLPDWKAAFADVLPTPVVEE
jgi:hypothetical protein